MSFRTHLKTLLASRDMNQRKLCALTGIDGGQMSRLINGESRPSRKTIERLVRALNCTPDESLDLHCLAGRIPREIEMACISSPMHARFYRMLAQMSASELEKTVAEYNERRNGGG